MFIKYLGHSAFFIKANRSVVTDPFHFIGYDMEKVSADFCLLSHGHFDHNASEYVQNSVVIDSTDKTFLAKDISLSAIKTFHDDKKGKLRGGNLVFKFVLDGVTFCHLGDLGESFSEELADRIGKCDVLFLPIGGTYTIDHIEAKKYADHIAPALIVPMHYKTVRSNIDISGLDRFISAYNSIIEQKGEFYLDRETLDNIKGSVLLFDDKKF